MPQLVRLHVTDLLGEFEHTVPFPRDAPFVILHGPNGVGKTKLLQLVVAVFGADPIGLTGLPFSTARLDFDNGLSVVVERTQADSDDPDEHEDAFLNSSVELILVNGEEEVDRWKPQAGPPRMTPALRMRLDQYPYLERLAPQLWRDSRTGRRLSLVDIVSAYPELRRFVTFGDPGDGPSEVEGPLLRFLNELKVHLIETQRLLPLGGGLAPSRHDPRERTLSSATVDKFAEDLTGRLSAALAQNSRTSQRLDRSFPRRLLSGDSATAGLTDEMIRERYSAQSLLRDRLASISVLDAADDLPLPARKLQDWERRVLWNYLEDTEEKLGTFRELLEKVNLLVEIVNARFLRKKLRIDPAQGFDFVTSRGTRIKPADLSSGEQHELVLVYDLLFNVSPGALVLIDEPEISLHVAWQQKFLNDLNRIATLTSLRFIIATHSPMLVNKWWSHAVPLAEEDNDEDEDEGQLVRS